SDRRRCLNARGNQLARFICLNEVKRERNPRKLRQRLGSQLDDDIHFARLQTSAPGWLNRLPLPATARQLSALSRKSDRCGARIPRNELDRQPDNMLEHERGIIRNDQSSGAAKFYRSFRGFPCFYRRNAACFG